MPLRIPQADAGQIIFRSTCLAAGLTDKHIARNLRAGAWVRVRAGAYVESTAWESLDTVSRHARLAQAAAAQARTDVVVSHLSALPFLGAPMWSLPLDDVHLTRTDQRTGRSERGVQQHRGVLRHDDVRALGELKVTTPTRTALDLTTVTSTEASLCVVNHFLNKGDTTIEQLRDRYRPMNHNPHTLCTDLVLRLADPRIESVGESRSHYLFWRQGLPAPEPQWLVHDHLGLVVARLDFAWPELRTWVEFDGKEKYVKHLRPNETVVDAVLREKRREQMVTELTGWRCVRISWADLATPERTAHRIRQQFRRPAA